VTVTVSKLTDHEGMFLSLLARLNTANTYQLFKIYSESPVSNFRASKGTVYPLILRMRKRGLLSTSRIANDGRGTEILAITEKGRAAVRQWVRQVDPTHLLPKDPLRTKLQAFDLLSAGEQLQWIAEHSAALLEKLEELEAYGREVTVPFKQLVHENALASLKYRLEWLELVRRSIRLGEGSESHFRALETTRARLG
jgi:DNA-binding PadR family transcriptional regulator